MNVGDAGDAATGDVAARLRAQAVPGLAGTSEVKAFGWAGFDDMLDTEFAGTPVRKGPYVCFSLRTDSRSVPASAVKREARAEEKAEAAREGVERLPRARLKDIREAVKARMLAAAPISNKAVELAWDPRGRIVHVFGPADGEGLAGLFEATFDAEAYPGVLPPSLRTAVDASGLDMSAGSTDVAGRPVEGTLMDDVGRDFLTFLWWHGETGGGRFGPDSAAVVSVRACAGNGRVLTFAARKDASRDARTEAKLSLLAGKKVDRAVVTIKGDGCEWTATLSSGLAAPVALSFPPGERIEGGGESGDEDPDAAVLERIDQVERFFAVRDRIFGHFLRLRADGALWRETCARMCAWAGEACRRMVDALPDGGEEGESFKAWRRSCGRADAPSGMSADGAGAPEEASQAKRTGVTGRDGDSEAVRPRSLRRRVPLPRRRRGARRTSRKARRTSRKARGIVGRRFRRLSGKGPSTSGGSRADLFEAPAGSLGP
jgi:hypothetical protein